MLIGTQELIHDINSKLILTHIINEGPISRATLAKMLGLTKATVSVIVQELIDKQLVVESGSDNTSRGRKPILLTFNPHCGYVITIDLEEDHLTLMTCHLNGMDAQLVHYPNNKSADEIVDYLTLLIGQILEALPTSYYQVVGICIGIHGVVNNNQIFFTPYAPYAGVDFVSALEEAFSIPVYLENEANLSIIGEKTFCYNYANMAGISIHSGIGLGLIINHELFAGYNGHAGEFGHTIVELNGRPCPCGNKGCFEQYASERALILQFAKKKHLPVVTLEHFIDAYSSQDPDALLLTQQFIEYMALGINNILNVLNPEIIVINSNLITKFPPILEQIEALLTSRIHNRAHLVPSVLCDTSILFGGVCICTQSFLGLKYLNFQSVKLNET
ncbi:MAG: ROK family transcriptional regulator [Clostridium sp.]|nr:ROK family transcriptional regulator [Clostridium sp.]